MSQDSVYQHHHGPGRLNTGITSHLAAHTIREFLGRLCDQPQWIAARDPREAKREASQGRLQDSGPRRADA